MNNYGITEVSKNNKKLLFKKSQRLNNTSFIIAVLLPIIVTALFAFGVIKGKKNIGPEYSVAKVVTSTSSGTCFLISETKLLTAKHVIDNLSIGDEVSIIFDKFDPPIETVAKILYMPSGNLTGFETSYSDYAVLECLDTEKLVEIPVLSLGASDIIETREEVYAIGYPEGNNENRITDGIIAATSFSNNGNEYDFLFDVNVDVDRGNSGGPLLTEDTEEVIGIIIMVNTGTFTKYNLALKIDKVKDELAKYEPNIDLDE